MTPPPSAGWSAKNRATAGGTDPRGFQQWKRAGRIVRKGEKACGFILVPCYGGTKDNPEKTKSFRSCAVFDFSQTDPIGPESVQP